LAQSYVKNTKPSELTVGEVMIRGSR